MTEFEALTVLGLVTALLVMLTWALLASMDRKLRRLLYILSSNEAKDHTDDSNDG